MVGACWYSNRVGDSQGRPDMTATQAPREQQRHRQAGSAFDPAEQGDSTRAADDGTGGGDDCMLAVWPPRPCSGTTLQEPPAQMGRKYEHGNLRQQHRADDDDGPWENLPLPVISADERAQMLKDLAARGPRGSAADE
jgi:hypothetical protein